MTPQVLLVLLSFAAALIFWLGFCYRGPSTAKTIIKTVPLVALSWAAILEGLSPWLVTGLILSALGDFALSRTGQRWFMLGLVAFAAAHVAYIGLFVVGLRGGIPLMDLVTNLNQGTDMQRAAVPLWVFGLVAVLWAAGALVFVRQAGALGGAVLVYMVLIGGMVLASGQRMLADQPLLLGAILFAASDFILATQMFRKLPRSWDLMASLAIWPLYYVGQFFILIGAAVIAF